MSWVQLRLFASNSYFVQLLLTSTASIEILQALVLHSGSSHHAVWLRAGLYGMWSTCAVSTGLIGFQRFQGTLVYMVVSARGPFMSLLPVIASASLFGLLAIPFAYALAWPLGIAPSIPNVPNFVALVLSFWCSALSLSLAMAALFVLTPNAIAYQTLVTIPLALLGGILGSVRDIPLVGWVAGLVPLSWATSILGAKSGASSALDTVLAIVASSAWFAAATVFARIALRAATVDGTLEVT